MVDELFGDMPALGILKVENKKALIFRYLISNLITLGRAKILTFDWKVIRSFVLWAICSQIPLCPNSGRRYFLCSIGSLVILVVLNYLDLDFFKQYII